MNAKQEKVYKVVDELSFDACTPDDLCELLASLYRTRVRVVLTYGNVETGVVWESATPYRGRIGRSTGQHKIPLLIRTARSHGGEALLDHCILRVSESVGGRLLWCRNGKDSH